MAPDGVPYVTYLRAAVPAYPTISTEYSRSVRGSLTCPILLGNNVVLKLAKGYPKGPDLFTSICRHPGAATICEP